MRRALVRRPSPRLADGLLTHIARVARRPRAGGAAVGGVRRGAGRRGLGSGRGAAADDCPDAAFVEDTVVVYADLAVIARPGADERKPETEGTERVLADLGYRIERIREPGTLDGGDVLKHGGTVWVGLGGRTNQSGVEQLAALLTPLGATVVGVPVSRVLHLKSAVTALPDGTVSASSRSWTTRRRGRSSSPVPEEAGSHVVLLGGDTVLMSTSARAAGAVRAAACASSPPTSPSSRSSRAA